MSSCQSFRHTIAHPIVIFVQYSNIPRNMAEVISPRIYELNVDTISGAFRFNRSFLGIGLHVSLPVPLLGFTCIAPLSIAFLIHFSFGTYRNTFSFHPRFMHRFYTASLCIAMERVLSMSRTFISSFMLPKIKYNR